MIKTRKVWKPKVDQSKKDLSEDKEKNTGVGPAKGWSRVVASVTKKSKEASSSESEYDVEQNVQDIMPLPKKQAAAGKQSSASFSVFSALGDWMCSATDLLAFG